MCWLCCSNNLWHVAVIVKKEPVVTATRMNSSPRQPPPQSRHDTAANDNIQLVNITSHDLVTPVTEPSYGTNTPRQSVFQDPVTTPNDRARVRDSRTRQALYDRLPRHYPGVWISADAGRVADIVARVTRPTVASVSRADACIRQRRHIHR
ncbi:hypothetical protein LSAT2_018081 [Lamellibrachia satsuma]|nr:hypothetical protein LSAT2_018081 [Lamellibrachia satsuma]